MLDFTLVFAQAETSATATPQLNGEPSDVAPATAAPSGETQATAVDSPSSIPGTISEMTQEAPAGPTRTPPNEAVPNAESMTVEPVGSNGTMAKGVTNELHWFDFPTIMLATVVLLVLGIASSVAHYLHRNPNPLINPAMVQRFVHRLWAWWLMFVILIAGLFMHRTGTIILFGLVSFWAFREFITMTPTRRGDHRALFWSLVVFTPLQYVLIALSHIELSNGKVIDLYGIYSIMIPVYASLFIPARIAIAGDHKRFLERSAQIQSGLLICVYCLSFAPALLDLKLATSNGQPWTGSNAGLLFFFVLISQVSEVLQWAWSRLRGRHVIAKDVSSSRTWEGVMVGTFSTGIIGALLFWVTPYTPWQAATMAIVVSWLGFAGAMTMSAIKRDRGVHDYGSLVLGHAGVLDRIDTLCFSAPIFYHLTRIFFVVS